MIPIDRERDMFWPESGCPWHHVTKASQMAFASKSILKNHLKTHEKIDTKKVDVAHVKARLWISTLLQMMMKSTPEMRCDLDGIAIKNLWLTTKRNIDGEHSR